MNRPIIKTVISDPLFYVSHTTYSAIKSIEKKYEDHRKQLREKKILILAQLDALDNGPLEQQMLLANYGILKKKKHTIKPVTKKMLLKLLDLPADAKLFEETA